MFKTILNYLSQASTWKGIFALIGALGVTIKPEFASAFITFALGAVGLIDFFVNERTAADGDRGAYPKGIQLARNQDFGK